MKKIFLYFFIIFNFTLYGQQNIKLEYYTKGINTTKFSLHPYKIDYKLPIKGSTTYNYVLVSITKEENKKYKKDIRIDLRKNKNFDYFLYLKSGPGKYKVTLFGAMSDQSGYDGLLYYKIEVLKNCPDNLKNIAINDQVIKYVNKVMGKKVGRGECWDLAQEILDYYNADWKRLTEFGIPLDPEKDEIKPGDIIQLYSLKLVKGNCTEYFGLPQHTAIVYKITDKKNYIIAHQNVNGKRYVLTGEFDLNYVVSGKYFFYRPIAGLIKNTDELSIYIYSEIDNSSTIDIPGIPKCFTPA